MNGSPRSDEISHMTLAIPKGSTHCIQVPGTVRRPLTPREVCMRTRFASLIVLLALPAALSAQVLRTPRRPTVPPPAPLPPTGGPVAQLLEFHRSRWSSEAYTTFSDVRVPAGS